MTEMVHRQPVWATARYADRLDDMAELVKKKRIGVHLGTAGGCWTAVNRAAEVGANTFQIFSASPRMWKAAPVKPEDAAKMRELRAKHEIGPVSRCTRAT